MKQSEGGAGRASAFALLCLLGAGCAQRAAANATEGAMAHVRQRQQETADDPTNQLVRVAAERAVQGAMAELDTPEQRARMQSLVDGAMHDAVVAAVRAGTVEGFRAVGAALTETSPLRAELAGVSAQMSAAAVTGAMAQLFPECAGASTAREAAGCRQRAVEELGRATAASAARGVRDVLLWPAVAFAGLAGIAAGVIGHWLWTLRERRARRARELRPA